MLCAHSIGDPIWAGQISRENHYCSLDKEEKVFGLKIRGIMVFHGGNIRGQKVADVFVVRCVQMALSSMLKT